MCKEQFWKLIDEARKEASDLKQVSKVLKEKLSQLEDVDIIHWHLISSIYSNVGFYNNIYAATSIIIDSHSDDDHSDLIGWLFTQGKDVLLRCLQDPDSIADLEANFREIRNSFDIFYIAKDAYYKKHDLWNKKFKHVDDGEAFFYVDCERNPLPPEETSGIMSEIQYGEAIEYCNSQDREDFAKDFPKLWHRFKDEPVYASGHGYMDLWGFI